MPTHTRIFPEITESALRAIVGSDEVLAPRELQRRLAKYAGVLCIEQPRLIERMMMGVAHRQDDGSVVRTAVHASAFGWVCICYEGLRRMVGGAALGTSVEAVLAEEETLG
jgi:hypothetical protein